MSRSTEVLNYLCSLLPTYLVAWLDIAVRGRVGIHDYSLISARYNPSAGRCGWTVSRSVWDMQTPPCSRPIMSGLGLDHTVMIDGERRRHSGSACMDGSVKESYINPLYAFACGWSLTLIASAGHAAVISAFPSNQASEGLAAMPNAI